MFDTDRQIGIAPVCRPNFGVIRFL